MKQQKLPQYFNFTPKKDEYSLIKVYQHEMSQKILEKYTPSNRNKYTLIQSFEKKQSNFDEDYQEQDNSYVENQQNSTGILRKSIRVIEREAKVQQEFNSSSSQQCAVKQNLYESLKNVTGKDVENGIRMNNYVMEYKVNYTENNEEKAIWLSRKEIQKVNPDWLRQYYEDYL